MMLSPKTPTCYECPYNLFFTENFAKKQMGLTMHPGERFCTAEKKAKRFRKSDPKRSIPSWCPKQKSPRELRIYGFKDTNSWMLHEEFCHQIGERFTPEAHRYAVVQEFHTELSAKEFLERVEMEPDTLLLGTLVHRHYVVEIDDGLKPAFFYKTASGYRYEPFFDGNRARSNKLEEDNGGV